MAKTSAGAGHSEDSQESGRKGLHSVLARKGDETPFIMLYLAAGVFCLYASYGHGDGFCDAKGVAGVPLWMNGVLAAKSPAAVAAAFRVQARLDSASPPPQQHLSAMSREAMNELKNRSLSRSHQRRRHLLGTGNTQEDTVWHRQIEASALAPARFGVQPAKLLFLAELPAGGNGERDSGVAAVLSIGGLATLLFHAGSNQSRVVEVQDRQTAGLREETGPSAAIATRAKVADLHKHAVSADLKMVKDIRIHVDSDTGTKTVKVDVDPDKEIYKKGSEIGDSAYEERLKQDYALENDQDGNPLSKKVPVRQSLNPWAGKHGRVVLWLRVEGFTALFLPVVSMLMLCLGLQDSQFLSATLYIVAIFQALCLGVGCVWSFGGFVPDKCIQGTVGDPFAYTAMWWVCAVWLGVIVSISTVICCIVGCFVGAFVRQKEKYCHDDNQPA